MKKTIKPEQAVVDYFTCPQEPLHRQYLALRTYFCDKKTAQQIEEEFGYAASTVYALARDFKLRLKESVELEEDPFFKQNKMGRKKLERDRDLVEIVVSLRKKQLSIPDIKVLLDSKGYNASECQIYTICDENGFTSAALCKYAAHEYLTKPSEAYLCNSTGKAFLGIDCSDL